MSSGFSYKDVADISFYDLDAEYFKSLYGELADIETKYVRNSNIFSCYMPPTKLEDIYGLERSKSGLMNLWKPHGSKVVGFGISHEIKNWYERREHTNENKI